ncbi:OmpA family protein [Roseateles sp. DC23W]|uniref:OmpA family protein n=1 Tax=Pelomonas dachongensis TaxID=3299029 RepID=A0ABW7ELC4_9BURK
MQITRTNTLTTGLVGALLLMLALSAPAQVASPSAAASANPVLKGAQVTEDALVDALAIEPANTGASGAMRGFRPASKPGGAPVKAGPGRASLLITFATNSTELAGETQGQVDTLARALQSDTLAGFSFRVEGHADARGDAGSNQRLSQLRAEAVMAYLTSKHGILPERLTAVGKGSSEPMNAARVDAPENRRVTIVTVRN